MKRLLAAIVLTMFVLTACTGSFTLTKKVHKFNRDFQNKWVEEVVFIAFVIVPVYGVATLGDALIFNSLEFWTGDNPVASTDAKAPVVAYNPQNGKVVISGHDNGPVLLTLEDANGTLLARDAKGEVVCQVVKYEDGSIDVFDAADNLLQHLAAAQVASLQARVAG